MVMMGAREKEILEREKEEGKIIAGVKFRGLLFCFCGIILLRKDDLYLLFSLTDSNAKAGKSLVISWLNRRSKLLQEPNIILAKQPDICNSIL